MRFCYHGHSFHEKSNSTAFLLDIIRSIGDVDIVNWDPDVNDATNGDFVSHVLAQKYDCHVFLQSEDIAARLRLIVPGRFIIIPMYDGAVARPDHFWQQFVNTRFLSFSRTHHEHLQALDCRSTYFKYFPAPEPLPDRDFDRPSAFFWERRPDKSVNQRVVLELCRQLGVRALHIHAAPDFDRHARPTSRLGGGVGGDIAVTRSTWFPDRKDYRAAAREPLFYFAPRAEEGIGMAFLEAMSCGQIVVAPDRPTMNEYISHGTSGILYDAGRPDIDLAFTASSLRRISEAATRKIEFGYADWRADIDRLTSILLDDGRRWSTGDVSSHFMNALLRSASSRATEQANRSSKTETAA